MWRRLVYTSTCRRDLMEFFDDEKNWGADEVRVGRAWKAEELRLKSNQDLHKLWYVLLKERNMLLTAEHFYEKTEKELFPNPERIDKVNESMQNLELVVKERNKAYWQLEVSEAEDGCRPVRHERNQFGILTDRPLEEHVEPETEENRVRPARPYVNRDVANFLKLRREAERTEANRQARRQHRHVIGLLKRFPDLDDDLLREKYPDVDLDKVRRDKRLRGNCENSA
ncbi:39S ribosomal protein L47, mitochondrial-like [Pollicipes pollicipes]|uniref:39S ribosomal protein L47, mitochondrial-like n=1 Tax=Pollicipes pollicipes TaxID=41117 RepID=UPI00188524CE|nr:39S ribosomal protein L47, mitochondrial-like [Pollicipes pollicipes]XP_037085223.1 39S ribosomal protein L47, mitochondrial-like [Pollicipes pollicipes]XP_037085224.1 39S ribosomal protein L47, mitochondrial-like [Pollicipes pollicipes]XP_037085225.1 39S ribosomal protein L47, mitochondrial-like [Pollicipes pollicipes]